MLLVKVYKEVHMELLNLLKSALSFHQTQHCCLFWLIAIAYVMRINIDVKILECNKIIHTK